MIEECGSAILIFTRDEKLFDESGKEFGGRVRTWCMS
jgi:hypothetical protein